MIGFGTTQMIAGSVATRVPITSNFNISGQDLSTDFSSPLLEGLVNTENTKDLYDLYREIYMLDSVCGPSVDILSMLPWSECDLMGIDDAKQLELFQDTLDELGVLKMMTDVSTTYLVMGNIVGSLLFDKNRGIFTDFIIHNPDSVELTPIPLRGYDPKVDLRLDPEFKKFLASNDPRDLEARKEISPELMQKFKGGKIELEPLSTLYLQRSVLPGVTNLSYYSRVLPIWLIEKALMRGTIIGAWRRQRSILHILAGGESWEPTDRQLAELTQLFQNADRDPQGAVVTTRNDIQAQEIRQGNDFWKISDEWDIFANAKMRALGINEAFLSGEATYSTAEVAMSLFMENVKAFRDFVTAGVLSNKIFLMTSKFHGFRVRTKAELQHRVRLSHTERNRDPYGRKKALGMYASRNLAEAAQYVIPEVHWRKELKATADSSVLELLKAAQEANIPVPLAMIANACGISLDSLIESFDEDRNYRKKIKVYVDEIKKEGLDFRGGGEEEGGGMFASTSATDNPLSSILKIPRQTPEGIKANAVFTKYLSNIPKDVVLDSNKAEQLLNYALSLSRTKGTRKVGIYR